MTWHEVSKYYNNCLDRKVFDRHKVLFDVFLPLLVDRESHLKVCPNINLLLFVTYNNYIAKTTGNLPLEIDCCCETCVTKNTSTFSVDKFGYYYVSGKKRGTIGTVFCPHM